MTEPTEWSNPRRWAHRLLYAWAAAVIAVIAICFLTSPGGPETEPAGNGLQVSASSEFCAHARRAGDLLHDNSGRLGEIAAAAQEVVNELRSFGVRSSQAEEVAEFFRPISKSAWATELADGACMAEGHP